EQSLCLRVGNIQEREKRLQSLLSSLQSATPDQDIFVCSLTQFRDLPANAIAYWIPKRLTRRIQSFQQLEMIADIRQGIFSGDNFRFLRLFHELPSLNTGWASFSKGGEPLPFVSDECLYIRNANQCIEMKTLAAQEYCSASRTIKNEETFGESGITYPQINDACLRFRVHPADAIYDMKGPVLFPRDAKDRLALLAFLNSTAVEDFMRMMTDGRQWHVSALKSVPF